LKISPQFFLKILDKCTSPVLSYKQYGEGAFLTQAFVPEAYRNECYPFDTRQTVYFGIGKHFNRPSLSSLPCYDCQEKKIMSDQFVVSPQPRSSTPVSDRLHNLTIPEAALQLGVSETRLRKTLTETDLETLVEFRQTKTGVRKTTILPPETIRSLDSHYRSPTMRGVGPFPDSSPAWQYSQKADEEAPPAHRETAAWEPSCRGQESAEEAAYLEQKRAEKNRRLEEARATVEKRAPGTEAAP
jgi:hypothetical protein